MIYQLLCVVGTGGSWVSKNFQAPSKGTVVSLQLGYQFNGAGGAGADVSIYAGVWPTAPVGTQTTDVIGAGVGPASCYAFMSATMREIAAQGPVVYDNQFIMTKIAMSSGQTIGLAVFSDSSIHSTIATCVFAFEPWTERR